MNKTSTSTGSRFDVNSNLLPLNKHSTSFTAYCSRLFLFFISILASLTTKSQANTNDFTWYNDAAEVTCQPGCLVTVQGDMTNNGQADLSVTHITNNGFIWVLGNVYGDDQFQQRGTGTTRLMNNTALFTGPYTGTYQTISGGYRVRGGQGKIAVDDGSFYNLEIANDQGLVFIKTNDADVTGTINFAPAATTQDGSDIDAGTVANRILTYEPGTASTPAAAPPNGNNYTTVFGLMNTAAGLANYLNVSTNLEANSPVLDNAYIQGKHRRAINSAGGTYGFPFGLEPGTSSTAARGIQFNKINFTNANNYDVVTGYFQQGSSNGGAKGLIQCTGTIVCTNGATHGEWNFGSLGNTGNYDMTIYPQDFTNICPGGLAAITKNDAFDGSGCGASPANGNGLLRSGLSGFTGGTGGNADFDWASNNSYSLAVSLLSFNASLNNCKTSLQWQSGTETGDNLFKVQYSTDGTNFSNIGLVAGTGSNSHYSFSHLPASGNAYYRLTITDNSGTLQYSKIAALTVNCGSVKVVSVYPNPADVKLNVLLTNITKATAVLYNAAGQQMWNGQLVNGSNWIKVGAFATGVYFLQVNDGSALETQKIIIKH